MKKTAILSFLFLAAIAFAQGIKFEEGNFKSILAKAKKENKLVFIDAYAVWCGPCKLMVKNIFPLKPVGDYYNANFVNAKIDMEKGEGIDLAKKYNVKVFPTYLFINGDGEEVHRTIGYVEEKDFIQFAMDAGDPNKRLTALKQKFEKGEKDPEFLLNLANLTIYNDTDFSNKVIERYFAGKPELNRDNLGLLFQAMKSTEGAPYRIFTERKADILKMLPEQQYASMDKNVKVNTVMAKAYNATTKKLDEAYFLAETQKFMTKDEAENLLKRVKASRALKDKDFATYEKITIELNKDTSALSADQLNSLAWNFFENVTTKSSLETAVKWAQESVNKNENYANTDTLANLYNKIGDKKNAKIWAQKSLELGKAAGEDTADTEKLLKSL
ncbi:MULTISPECIES: thioredoxin family protein [Chryseobacterium]|uniref:thioredoxin family protein n=1 Tax=Chryseobacterium TaxID=59732 RepID=UPI00195A1B0E|nr:MULTISPECIES: thioredoxin family protein [Chryseobacterium]MBM7419074.1 thiol:disulfide interchange protein [Chryseobacterium sp. JUb44]MDH6208996.1 thiol:disulfide interchange protein [Chryseobacterium sp. BIGb0186]WSO11851.1 thioredoxin family protein [Chryseobacterium scophthalmum]